MDIQFSVWQHGFMKLFAKIVQLLSSVQTFVAVVLQVSFNGSCYILVFKRVISGPLSFHLRMGVCTYRPTDCLQTVWPTWTRSTVTTLPRMGRRPPLMPVLWLCLPRCSTEADLPQVQVPTLQAPQSPPIHIITYSLSMLPPQLSLLPAMILTG